MLKTKFNNNNNKSATFAQQKYGNFEIEFQISPSDNNNSAADRYIITRNKARDQ